MLQDRPRNWVVGGIILLILGYFGPKVFGVAENGSIVDVTLTAFAIAGWVVTITGIVQYFRHKNNRADK